MILLNFTHPLTEAQVAQVRALSGQETLRLVALSVHFDTDQPFVPQVAALLAQLPLSPEELQTEPILVNLPSLNYIAALLLAELHGRMGHFPAVLRLRPLPGSVPTRYEVAELLNLQAVREAARRAR